MVQAVALGESLRLPGSLQEQGFGDEVSLDTDWVAKTGTERGVYPDWFTDAMYAMYRQPGQIRFPYWLQPKKHYVGPAWYQRAIELPPDWTGKRITLTLERCHWATQLWIDGCEIGSRDSLATPQVYDLGTRWCPGDTANCSRGQLDDRPGGNQRPQRVGPDADRMERDHWPH